MTQQRQVILEIIRERAEHLTAEEIFLLAKQKLPKLALGTVYRNLGLMVESGEVALVSIPDQPNHYDKYTAEHDHFRCTVCNRLYDMPRLDVIPALSEVLGMEVTDFHLSAEGVCSSCKAEHRPA